LSKQEVVIRDQPYGSKDRFSQEGGDDRHHPAHLHPSTNDEDEALDLRTNPFQEGGDDGRGPNTNPLKGHQTCQIEVTTRVMVKRGQEDAFYMPKTLV